MHRHNVQQRFRTRAVIAVCALAIPLAIVVAHPQFVTAQAKAPAVYTGIVKGVAVGGYDPVAYFTKGKAVPGSPAIVLEHQGATWRFESAESRDAFRAAPGKYAPQYGGHCAWAVAEGYTAKGDPNAWSIVDGKLYLNYDKSVQRTWERASRPNITKGDANWPKLSAR